MLNGRIYSYENPKGGFGQKFIGTLAFLALISLCLFLFYHIYRLLYFASPLFIIVALILNYRIVGNHIRMIGHSFKQNFFAGLVEFGLQIIGLPIVSLGLVVKAWAFKKFGEWEKTHHENTNTETQYTSYEEVSNTPAEEKIKEISKKESSNYDDLFE